MSNLVMHNCPTRNCFSVMSFVFFVSLPFINTCKLERTLGRAHTFANATHQSWGNVSFKSPYYWELNSAHFGAGFMQIGYKLAEISQKFVFDLLVTLTLTFDPITPKKLINCSLGHDQSSYQISVDSVQ